QLTGSFNKSRDIFNTWSTHFRKNFYKDIWRTRCKVLIEAEKQQGISNHMKRTYTTNVIGESNKVNQNNNQNNYVYNNISNSFNIIKGWVSKGIKFLDFKW